MWSSVAEFVVIGQPKPQPRPRAFAKAFKEGKVSARMYDPSTAEGWKAEVALAAKRWCPATPYEFALAVELDFYLKRPQRLLRKKSPRKAISAECNRADVDNLAKAVMDALTTVQFWKDDKCVVGLNVRKFYAPIGGRTGALIRIERWTGEVPPGPQRCPLELCPEEPL